MARPYDDDAVTIAEKVGVALADGDLRQRVGAGALETIGALGLTGIHFRLSDAVFRLKYANDPQPYEEALKGVYGLARSLDTRERWRLKRWRLRVMAKAVLDYWLNDLCRTCNGVKFMVAGSSARLSSHVCGGCGGTGRRRMPWERKLPRRPEGRRGNRTRVLRWREVVGRLSTSAQRHKTLLVALEEMERRVGVEMRRRMSARSSSESAPTL